MGRYLIAETHENAFQYEKGQAKDVGLLRPQNEIRQKRQNIFPQAGAIQTYGTRYGIPTLHCHVFPQSE
jgi:hypothetical protein